VGEVVSGHGSMMVGRVRVPPGRDLYVDLLRLVAMAAVVLLHWISVVPSVERGVIVDRNVVDVTTGLWPLTWLGEVMALFFFVGGYANWVSLEGSLRRRESAVHYVVRRYNRLLRPTLAFLGVWLGIDLLARALGHVELSPLTHVTTASTIPFGPLWFVGVYLVIIALSPLTMAAHRRWGARAVAVMIVGVALADAVTFATGFAAAMALNVVLVWSVPHQLGYLYADGTLRRLTTRGRATMAVLGLLAIVSLTSLPYYPRSLVTLPWKVSFIAAPMLTQVASAFWLVGLALLAQPSVDRWLRRPLVRRVVEQATPLAMPVFLWHMTAYLVAASALVVAGADFVYGMRTDAVWWCTRPVLVLFSTLALMGILLVLRSLRRISHRLGSDPVRA
jgi:Acyltransferase family